MTDNTELKRLAEAAQYQNHEFQHELVRATTAFFEGCIPEQILELIAERDQLKAEIEELRKYGEEFAVLAERRREEVETLRKERDGRHPFKPFHEPAIGFTGCVICGVYTDHGGLPCPKTRATADAAVGQEMIWCACGDGYPVNSHGAGFMDANNGVCANCDSVNQGAEPDLDAPNALAVLRKALSDLLALYDEDEGCRNLPQYIAGRAAMGKGELS